MIDMEVSLTLVTHHYSHAQVDSRLNYVIICGTADNVIKLEYFIKTLLLLNF